MCIIDHYPLVTMFQHPNYCQYLCPRSTSSLSQYICYSYSCPITKKLHFFCNFISCSLRVWHQCLYHCVEGVGRLAPVINVIRNLKGFLYPCSLAHVVCTVCYKIIYRFDVAVRIKIKMQLTSHSCTPNLKV